MYTVFGGWDMTLDAGGRLGWECRSVPGARRLGYEVVCWREAGRGSEKPWQGYDRRL